MALVDTLKGSFSSGELSPRMAARQTIDRYKNGAIQIENLKVLTQGGLIRCEGTHFVAAGKTGGGFIVLFPFEPSTTDAYIIEAGNTYLRFYKNHTRIESPPGTPVEVETTYADAHLRFVRTAQSNDVMIMVHGTYAPRRLSRLSDTSWDWRLITFDPPPTYEAGVSPATALTLSSTTGIVTVTAGVAAFLPSDVQRQLVSGVGRGIVTAVASTTSATMRIIEAFSSTSIASGAWTLRNSPNAGARPSATGPVGAQITIALEGEQIGATELVAHGSFDSGFTGWTTRYYVVIATGTHNGVGNEESLTDTTADFLLEGIQAGQIVNNLTDGSTGVIAAVTTTSVILASPGLVGGPENDFDVSDAYEIRTTGSASVSGGSAVLNGGPAGSASIEQAVTTVVGTRYRVAFTVADGPMIMQVGTGSLLGNALAPATYAIGPNTAFFTATSTTSYLQFSTNQPTTSRVTVISVKSHTMTGFRTTETGTYVRLNGGLVRVLVITGSEVTGEVVKELSTTDMAVAGAWSLESPQWSDVLGWPETVVLYEGRLFFMGSARFPQTRWYSAIDSLFDFFKGTNPDDGGEETLIDSGGNITLNRTRWMMPAENMLVGTTHGEYRSIGSGDDPITPTSPTRNRIQSTYGSAAVQPLKIGGNLLFAQRMGSKIRELAYDERTQTTFDALDITVTSDHLLKDAGLIAGMSMVYQQEPDSIVWCVRADGQLLGLTYNAREDVKAWWRRTTQGFFESVAVIPHPTLNAHEVWVVVRRNIGDTLVRYIEYFDSFTRMELPEPVEMFNELTEERETVTGWAGLTLDACVTYSGVPEDTFTASPLVGAEIYAVGDGLVFGPYTMTVDGITLPQAVSTCWIGLLYTPRGRTLPLELPVRGETHQGKRKSWRRLVARVQNTGSLTLAGQALPFRTESMPTDQGVAPFSGDRGPAMMSGWTVRGMVSFSVDEPLPCTILGILGTAEVEVER